MTQPVHITEKQINEKLAELSRRYNEAEDRCDWHERKRVYAELIQLGAQMRSDGRFYLQETQ